LPQKEAFESESFRFKEERNAGIEEFILEQRYPCQGLISTAKIYFYRILKTVNWISRADVRRAFVACKEWRIAG
jgi:hypothetical protein